MIGTDLSSGYKKSARNLIAIIVFLVLMGFILTISPITRQKLQNKGLQIITPILKAGSATRAKAEAFIAEVEEVEKLRDENQILRTQIDQLRTIQIDYNQMRSENDRLRTELDFRQKASVDMVPCSILTYRRTIWSDTIEVDRGERDGLKVGDPVLCPDGLVGKIVSVAPGSSRVILLTDEQCRIAARVQGTQERGILYGQSGSLSSKPSLILRYLSVENDKLRPGASVFSSGDGDTVPSGLLLGKVISFSSGDLYGEAKVEPAVDFQTLRHLFVARIKEN